jgi:hypothetical protein
MTASTNCAAMLSVDPLRSITVVKAFAEAAQRPTAGKRNRRRRTALNLARDEQAVDLLHKAI